MSTTPQTETPVLAEKAGGVLTLTLNRPDTLNSLTPALIDALREQIEGAADDDEVRAIIADAVPADVRSSVAAMIGPGRTAKVEVTR